MNRSSRHDSTLVSVRLLLLRVALILGVLLNSAGVRWTLANEEWEYQGCFRVGAGLVEPAECPNCQVEYIDNPMGISTPNSFCPDGTTNEAIAFLKCEAIGPNEGQGNVVCFARDEIVGLQYACKREWDYDGIELQLILLGALTADCIAAIATQNPVALATCLIGVGAWNYFNSGCAYQYCVGDPWQSTPIIRPVYQSVGGAVCNPTG